MQPARLALEKKGIVLFRDSSANKGGVTSSSLEVLAGMSLSDAQFFDLMTVRFLPPLMVLDVHPPSHHSHPMAKASAISTSVSRLPSSPPPLETDQPRRLHAQHPANHLSQRNGRVQHDLARTRSLGPSVHPHQRRPLAVAHQAPERPRGVEPVRQREDEACWCVYSPLTRFATF